LIVDDTGFSLQKILTEFRQTVSVGGSQSNPGDDNSILIRQEKTSTPVATVFKRRSIPSKAACFMAELASFTQFTKFWKGAAEYRDAESLASPSQNESPFASDREFCTFFTH